MNKKIQKKIKLNKFIFIWNNHVNGRSCFLKHGDGYAEALLHGFLKGILG